MAGTNRKSARAMSREGNSRKGGGQRSGPGLEQQAEMASWPTTRAEDSESTGAHLGVPDTLTSAARLANWPTPTVGDSANAANATSTRHNPHSQHHSGTTLVDAASWATPTTRDHKDGTAQSCQNVPINSLLGRQVNLSPAEMAKPGQLNPRFSLWLQGYKTAWASCGERVIRSSRKSRRK